VAETSPDLSYTWGLSTVPFSAYLERAQWRSALFSPWVGAAHVTLAPSSVGGAGLGRLRRSQTPFWVVSPAFLWSLGTWSRVCLPQAPVSQGSHNAQEFSGRVAPGVTDPSHLQVLSHFYPGFMKGPPPPPRVG
jgi:hypothetical protein